MDLLFKAARCSSARANCEVAACRFTAAVGSAEAVLPVEVPLVVVADVELFGVLANAQLVGENIAQEAAKTPAAKTGETRAKPLRKKNLAEVGGTEADKSAGFAPIVRKSLPNILGLNVIPNPPPQRTPPHDTPTSHAVSLSRS
jgi:hypothetical protein